jgi:hypothetical protein
MFPSSSQRPNQLTQLYFPGGHGGVGGGDLLERKLSESTLRFLVEEMARRNLSLELNTSMIPTGSCDVAPPPVTSMNVTDILASTLGDYVRPISSLTECYLPYVVERYRLQKTWRPEALKKFDKELSVMDIPPPVSTQVWQSSGTQ